MKQKWLFLFLGMLLPLALRAQADMLFAVDKTGKLLILPKKKEYVFHFPKQTYTSYTPAPARSTEGRLSAYTPGEQPAPATERPMNMQVLSAAYRPLYDAYAPMLRRVSPMAFDFDETAFHPLSTHAALFLNGKQYTWPGAGGLTTLTGGLQWTSGGWTLAGYALGGKYYTPLDPSPRFFTGGGAAASYEVNPRLRLRAWGQYVGYGSRQMNPHRILNPFFEQTGAGGAAELMLNEHLGVGAGVNYEYNPIRRKMEPQYLLYPVIRAGNRIRISIQ